MKRLQDYIKEITILTLKIQEEYPELYQYLGEDPITIPNGKPHELDTKMYAEYLDSLKKVLKEHVANHSMTESNKL